jgi:MFS family permease
MVYPTLLAFVSDLAPPAWRGAALGVYRFWRDLGYLVGAVSAGLIADAAGEGAAIWAAAGIVAFAAVAVALAAREAAPV